MSQIIVSGEKRLEGTVDISGSKNAALPILAATVMIDEPVVVKNVPELRDVHTMLSILQRIGKKVSFEHGAVFIEPGDILLGSVPYDLVGKMRASFNLFGPLVMACGWARVGKPGGCNIGQRPVDYHVKGLKRFGLKIVEEHGDVYLYLGLCKANLGEYALAIDYLKKANIWNYNAYFYLGFSYFQQREYLKAQDALEKALSLNPPLEDKLSIALYLATTYRELQRFEKAIILLQELVKVAPEVREIHNLMGICYFKEKDYQEASECFQKAINLAPDSAIDYANLGLCLKALGKKEQAKFYCQKALSLDPSLDFAQKALEELAR